MTAADPRFELIYRNYIDQFGEPLEGHNEIQRDEASPVVSVMTFNGFSPGARIFATIGLCQFDEELGQSAEFVLTADDALDDAMAGLVQVVSFLVDQGVPITIGDTFFIPETLGRISSHFGKVALYTTFGRYLLGGGDLIHCGTDDHVVIYQLLLISAPEREFLLQTQDPREFERRLASAEIVPASVGRPSAI
jgi:hypothetical protein